jgi:hypothetical protein
LEHLSSGEGKSCLGTPCGYALEGTQMDNQLNLEQPVVLDAEQAMLDEGGSIPPSVASESLMEMRFLSSCTNVSRM